MRDSAQKKLIKFAILSLKVNKLKNYQRIVRSWNSTLPSKYLYQNYKLDVADLLHKLELDYIANGGELSNIKLKLAEENVPNIEMPEVYFQPLVEYLDLKGIRFKGQEPLTSHNMMNYI